MDVRVTLGGNELRSTLLQEGAQIYYDRGANQHRGAGQGGSSVYAMTQCTWFAVGGRRYYEFTTPSAHESYLSLVAVVSTYRKFGLRRPQLE